MKVANKTNNQYQHCQQCHQNLVYVVSKMQVKERGEGAKKKNQYQHCQQDHQHLVSCGVKSAR